MTPNTNLARDDSGFAATPSPMIEKSIHGIRSRHHSQLITAKEAIAVERNAVVTPIAHALREYPHGSEKGPGHRELTHDVQEGIALGMSDSLIHQQHGFEAVRRQAKPLQDGLALGRLHGAELEDRLLVVAKEKPAPAIAQPAHAIEQDHLVFWVDWGLWIHGCRCGHGCRLHSVCAVPIASPA